MTQAWIQIGQIYREYGVKGFFKAHIYSGSATNLQVGKTYQLTAIDQQKISAKIEAVQTQGRYFLIKLSCFKNPEAILPWRKAIIEMPAERLQRLSSGEMYDFEWKGYSVFVDAQPIGKISEIVYIPQRTWQLKLQNGKEIFVPFCLEWILRHDFEKREIELKLPEGLLEL